MDWKSIAIEKLKDYEAKRQALSSIPLELATVESSMTSIRSSRVDGTPVKGGGSGYEDRMLGLIVKKQELEDNKAQHASWIKECQELIARITDKSVEIQAMEARNKQAVEEQFRRERKGYNQGKRSVEIAQSYYRSMNRTGVVPPHFMDQKK